MVYNRGHLPTGQLIRDDDLAGAQRLGLEVNTDSFKVFPDPATSTGASSRLFATIKEVNSLEDSGRAALF